MTATEAKHTEGPWTATGWQDTVVNDSEGNTLALYPGGDCSLETVQANASLIAAAPELYEACRRALDFIDDLPIPGNSIILRDLRDVIAKAEGRD
jgi:hypothetical protein